MIDLILGDCITEMQKMESNIIDLTVTSPPYDNLRTYAGTLEWNFEIFKQVANELYRVTKDGGVVVWVVGDATIKGSETGTSFRQALYFKEICFNLHDTMIWLKTDPPPQTKVGKRYTSSFEYMFVFSKGKINIYNPIMIDCKTAGKNTGTKGSQRKENGGIRSDRVEARINTIVNKQKPLTNVWENSGSKGYGGHPATFPEKLIEKHILSWSNEGDTVLDPFMGSGTTGKMAKLNNRKFIGIEKVEEYYGMAKNRIEST